jgi:diguanylate cyclase (GGDEF)-like protein/PAS domain S-box-containing protein
MAVMSEWMKAMYRSLPCLAAAADKSPRDRAYRMRLDEFRAQLIGIIESSNDAIIGKTLDGVITSWNAGAEKLFGYSSQEAIGSKMLLIFPPGREHEEADILARIAAGESIENFETVRISKSGQAIDVAVTISPIRNQDGRIIGASKVAHSIVERKKTEAALLESNTRLQLLIEHAPAAIAMFDRHMHYLAVSRRWLMDYGIGERDIVGLSHYEIFPEISNRWREIHARGMAGEVISSDEDAFRRRDGSVQWLKWDVRPWRTASEQIGGIVIFSEEITARKLAQDELRVAAKVFDSHEGMVVANRHGIVLRVNRAFCDITGYEEADLVGKSASILQANDEDPLIFVKVMRALKVDGFWKGEVWNKRKDGKPYVAWMTISTVPGSDNKPTHYVAVCADITESKRAEANIHELAYYDPLTHLPNRRSLYRQLGRLLGNARRANALHAVIFMDLDNFKVLNDTRGHDAGDELLREAAARIKQQLRGWDMVARIGGDEFVMMLEDLGEDIKAAVIHAGAVAEKLRQALAEPYMLRGSLLHSSASLGIALFRGSDESLDSVLQHADLAMYQAKAAGRNCLRFFDPTMQTALDLRSTLEADLRQAVGTGQLRLHYQPQVDETGKLFGAEALLRWVHPVRGMVSPGEFIPLAEDTGLILPIGLWVLQSACAQLQAWATRPVLRDLRLAINVSALQFRLASFVDLVRDTAAKSGADTRRLTLEITESVMLGDMQDTLDKMSELKALGICFSVDDFGTGNSSLSYLSRLPLDELKIDQSFVANLPDSHNDAVIAQTIIRMATSLGLSVVAEGVETGPQQLFLRENGCRLHQGFLISRPLPLPEFELFAATAAQG